MTSDLERLARVFPGPSVVSRHDDCRECVVAEKWVSGRDAAEGRPNGPARTVYDLLPSWLQAAFEWGPVQWPFHWCDLFKATEVDCGVFSYLCSYLLVRRGVLHFRAQVVLPCTRQESGHWRGMWDLPGFSDDWILTDLLVYHEAIALPEAQGAVVLFDTTDLRVLGPEQADSRYRPRAVRVESAGLDLETRTVLLNESVVPLGEWRLSPSSHGREGSGVA